jgi:hypothetical protein
MNLSIITNMTSLPSFLEKPQMKSMIIIDQGPSGIGNGCSSPGFATVFPLFNWHTLQFCTWCSTVSFNLGQKIVSLFFDKCQGFLSGPLY